MCVPSVFSKDKFEEADEEYSQAATLLEPLVRKDVKCAAALTLAKIFRKRGDLRIDMGMYHDALKDFKKYRKLVELLGNALEIQRSHHSLGRAYFMLGISSKGINLVYTERKKVRLCDHRWRCRPL